MKSVANTWVTMGRGTATGGGQVPLYELYVTNVTALASNPIQKEFPAAVEVRLTALRLRPERPPGPFRRGDAEPRYFRSRALARRFHGQIVVADDLGFSVALGECLGIIGPNGAGKIAGSTCWLVGRRRLCPARRRDVTADAAARALAGIGRTYPGACSRFRGL